MLRFERRQAMKKAPGKFYEPPHREAFCCHCDVCGVPEPWPPARPLIDSWRIESHKRQMYILCSDECYVSWMLTHG